MLFTPDILPAIEAVPEVDTQHPQFRATEACILAETKMCVRQLATELARNGEAVRVFDIHAHGPGFPVDFAPHLPRAFWKRMARSLEKSFFGARSSSTSSSSTSSSSSPSPRVQLFCDPCATADRNGGTGNSNPIGYAGPSGSRFSFVYRVEMVISYRRRSRRHSSSSPKDVCEIDDDDDDDDGMESLRAFVARSSLARRLLMLVQYAGVLFFLWSLVCELAHHHRAWIYERLDIATQWIVAT